MKTLEVYLETGRVIQFDTQTYCTAEPFKGEGSGDDAGMPKNNMLTEFQIRGDLLETEGLCIETYWHNTVVDAQTRKSYRAEIDRDVYHAGREVGRIVRVASLKDLELMTMIVADGQILARRQGRSIINMLKFNAAEILFCSASPSASIAARAMTLYHYFKNAAPEASDEEIAGKFGFTLQAFEEIRALEESQQDWEEEDAPPLLGATENAKVLESAEIVVEEAAVASDLPEGMAEAFDAPPPSSKDAGVGEGDDQEREAEDAPGGSGLTSFFRRFRQNASVSDEGAP